MNTTFEVKESADESAAKYEFTFDFGNDAADAIARNIADADTQFENYLENSRIRLQDAIRRMLKKNATYDECKAFVAAYKIGEKRARIVTKKVMTVEEMFAAIAKMPAEEKAKYAALATQFAAK